MGESHHGVQAQSELIHPDCLDAAYEFTSRLDQLIAEAKEAGLSDEEISEALSDADADVDSIGGEDASSNPSEEPPEHINATGLILDAKEGMEIKIEYDSSYGNGTKTVSGVVTSVDRGLWVRFQTEGGSIEVFGSELSNRENGEVKDATRRIGYLTDYTLTTHRAGGKS